MPTADRQTSRALYQRACRCIPGGVNSPVRAFAAVGGHPLYITRGAGSRVWTADGIEMLDFCGSWGPLILGHAHPAVVAAVRDAAARGTSFGACTPAEVELAELISELVPEIDQVRLVNSGTEATMTALRLARGATGRQKIVKFDGCYHGHSDGLLVAAGSGLLTAGRASSAGVPEALAADVYVLPYNDADAVAELMAAHGDTVAAVIVEPVAGNMGLVAPVPGFLEALREQCDRHGTVLIFDEVITGFRLGPTTYAAQHGLRPDLTCLGKIIGGGLPVGAVGGRRDLMAHLAPLGDVYQAGTLSGNPVALAAGLATLRELRDLPPYPTLAARAERLAAALDATVAPGAHVARVGGMFTLFCGPGPVRNLADAKTCDTARFAAWHAGMLARGIYLPPSQFETAFVSTAHTAADIETFAAAAGDVWQAL